MANAVRNLKVESDTVCPYCLLGITQFQTALSKWSAEHPSTPVDAEYHLKPFQLRAEHAEKPFDRNEFSVNAYGAERWANAFANLSMDYKEVGLEIAKNAMLSNTNTAHRLEQLALDTKGPGTEFALGLELMREYQLDGVAPSDRAMLSRVAVKHGLFDDEEEATKWLNGMDKDAETQARYKAGRAEGVTGVPHFVFQDKYVSSGAIGVDGFYSVIDQVMNAPA